MQAPEVAVATGSQSGSPSGDSVRDRTASPAEADGKLFRSNLFLIALTGTLLGAWSYWFAGWFQIIGGVLAVSGILSWLASVSQLISKEHTEQQQVWIDRTFLLNPRTKRNCLLILLCAGVIGSFLGTVEVKAVEETAERLVLMEGRSGDWEGSVHEQLVNDGVRLLPGGRTRDVFLTSWFSAREVRVKVAGYPYREVEVRPWGVSPLVVPGSFLRPAVLLRPETSFIGNRGRLRVQVKINRGEPITADFDGFALWLGCHDDVEVPRVWRQAFEHQLAAKGQERFLKYSVRARQFDRVPQLEPGNVVQVSFLRVDKNGEEQPYGKPLPLFNVHPVRRLEDFPQVVLLRTPDM